MKVVGLQERTSARSSCNKTQRQLCSVKQCGCRLSKELAGQSLLIIAWLSLDSIAVSIFVDIFCPHFVGLKTLLSVYKVLVFGNLVTILAKLQQMLFIRQNTIMIYTGCQSVEVLILILLLWVQKTIVYFDIYVSYSVNLR